MKKKKVLKSVKRKLKMCIVCKKRRIDEAGDYCKKCAYEQQINEYRRAFRGVLG